MKQDPLDRALQVLVARKVGSGIVLETRTKEGYPDRWSYSDITLRSFHYHAEESHDGGKTWVAAEDVFARRVSAKAAPGHEGRDGGR